MTLKELNNKHFQIASKPGWENNPFEDEHTKLSIEFTISVLEELRIIGLKFDCRLGTVDADTLSLYVHIKGITAESISRHINYRFDARKELELLAFDIQKMLCIERQAQTDSNQSTSTQFP